MTQVVVLHDFGASGTCDEQAHDHVPNELSIHWCLAILRARDGGSPSRPEMKNESYPALPRDERVTPLHQNTQPIPESRQIQDVHEEPEEPCRHAAERQPRKLGQGR
jgi:hypothetical protein